MFFCIKLVTIALVIAMIIPVSESYAASDKRSRITPTRPPEQTFTISPSSGPPGTKFVVHCTEIGMLSTISISGPFVINARQIASSAPIVNMEGTISKDAPLEPTEITVTQTTKTILSTSSRVAARLTFTVTEQVANNIIENPVNTQNSTSNVTPVVNQTEVARLAKIKALDEIKSAISRVPEMKKQIQDQMNSGRKFFGFAEKAMINASYERVLQDIEKVTHIQIPQDPSQETILQMQADIKKLEQDFQMFQHLYSKGHD